MGRHWKKWLISMLLAGSVALPSWGQSCLTQADWDARRVRHFQTQLMVAALQCRGENNQGQRALYNDFIAANKDKLAQHGTQLIDSFERRYGRGHKSKLDAYVTQLANEISLRSMKMPDFCHQIADMAGLLTTSHLDWWDLALDLAPVRWTPDPSQCGTGEGQTLTSVE